MKQKKHSENVTLSVSRDGVSLGIAPFGNFEMVSVATVSVYDIGKLDSDICTGMGNESRPSEVLITTTPPCD
jgi:hypothetical protein